MQKGIKYFFSLLIIFTILFITIKSDIADGPHVKEDINAPEYTPEPDHKENFSEEWERKMSDYEPDFVYMIPIDYKTSEVFYQKFNKAPFKMRGALLVDEEKEERVKFKIESPSGKVIYKGTTGQLKFEHEITETGIYKFYFDNKYINTELRVTFTLNSGNNDVIKKADLDFSHQKASELFSIISKMKNERKIS